MWLALTALITAGPLDVPLAAFMRVPPPKEEKPGLWSWPTNDEFSAVWSKREAVRTVGLVEGVMTDDGKSFDVLIAVHDSGSYVVDHRHDDYVSDWLPGEWKLQTAKVGETLEHRSEGKLERALKITRRVEPTVASDAAWVPFTYVTVLQRHDGPVYDDAVERGGGELAKAQNDDERLAAYRRFRPMGRCSMDTRPQQVAGEYRDLCQKLGRIGCFSTLQVQVMNNSFDRVAYSSYGEAAAGTHADALVGAGINIPRFLVGATVQLDDKDLRPMGMNAWRMARAIHESGQRDVMKKQLRLLVEDESLDELNRVLFAKSLQWLETRFDDEKTEKSSAQAKKQEQEALQGLKLPRWLANG